MTQRQRQDAAINSLRLIPTKWAIIIVAILIAYVVAQPRLNDWFGLNLPSLTSLVGDDSAQKKPAPKDSPKQSSVPSKQSAERNKSSDAKDQSSRPPDATERSESESSKRESNKSTTANKPDNTGKPNSASSKRLESSTKQSAKVHGILTSIGNDRFESPNGLIYGPGSEQGHRIKHIERHLADDPGRPGSHGVFDGSLDEFLIAIDDAYLRAKRGEKGTTRKEEDNTTIYEASFSKPIGFQGGIEGGKRKHPKLKKLRIVVRGNSLITAFPF